MKAHLFTNLITPQRFQKTRLCKMLLTACLVSSAHATDHEVIISPNDIEQKLAQTDWQSHFNATASPKGLDMDTTSSVATIKNPATPIGLDLDAITRLPTLESVMEQADDTLDPTAYIPDYQAQNTETTNDDDTDEFKNPHTIKRLYNQLFKDGAESASRIKVHFYHSQNHSTDMADLTAISRQTQKSEPFANIHATLTDMTAQSIANFRASVPRLRQAIISAGRAVGYYDMDFSITKADAGEINLIMHDVGKPVVVDAYTLDLRGQGADTAPFQKIKQNPPINTQNTFHHGAYEATKTLVNDTSGEHGYFDGRWLNHAVDVLLPDNIADVSLVYDTGTQYAFDDVVFFTIDPVTKELTTDPDKLPVTPKILKQLMTFKMGDAYNRTAVRNLSNSLLATGYFNAVNTETVLPNRQTDQSVGFETRTNENTEQTVALDDGTTATISPIEFSTSQAISDKLALVTQKAEQLYNAPEDRLLITDTSEHSKSILARLSDAVSNIAKMVLPDESKDEFPVLDNNIEPPTLAGRKTGQEVYDNKKVPLYVFVLSDKPKDAQLGMGWGSDSGVRVLGKLEHNLINKHGTQAGIDARLSKHKKGVQTYLTHPIRHPLNDKFQATLSYDEETLNQNLGNFDLKARMMEMGISRNRISDSSWSRVYSLRYRLDELETHAPREIWQDLPVRFIDGKPTQEALLLGYAMNKVVTDNPLSPMQGYRQSYSLELGSKSIISDANMAIARAGVSGIYSFGDNSYGKQRAHQLIGGVNVGYLWSDNFDNVPYKLRFFAGGDQSIRGYNYQSLSPISDKGYLTGGQAIAVGTAEYNYEVWENLRLGVFTDIGNAYDRHFNNETKMGVGVGVRYASPVGQVRLDIATGVGEEGNPIKLHFFIGLPF